MITVVGTGPGHPDYMTQAAIKCIREADVLIGAKRVLATLAEAGIDVPGKETFHVTGHVDAALAAIRDNSERNVVVVVSGDPGFYSFLKTIRDRLPGIPVTAVPGISSAQLLFSLIAQDWQDVSFVSVHGRPLDELAGAIRHNRKICVLTDTASTAPVIGRYLADLGIKGRAVIGANLSYPDQEVIDTTIDELSRMEGLGSSVLYIEIGNG